jgi:CheY-like chemotaxis protein
MKTLVLIDNDALSRALLSQCLSGRGWRVLEAEDGESGLELVEKNRPAAVICDLRTPKRNGFKVCREIRERAALKLIRVLLTSVSRFANDRDSAFAAGAHDYFVKPIVPADLLASLDRCRDEVLPSQPQPVVIAQRCCSGACAVRFRRPACRPRCLAATPPVEVRVGESCQFPGIRCRQAGTHARVPRQPSISRCWSRTH